MFMQDTLTLDGPRRDGAGNLVASVLCARSGCQDYAGYEVGKPDMARVVVYRPSDEVFARDSMKSYAGAPVTIEHPSEAVTPANWKDHAVGEASEEIVRDGEAVRVPFMLRDAAGIAAVEAGKREISMGYDCSLIFEDGTAPDGTVYQAVQRNIRINHLAIVDRARGGPTLRIGDQEQPMTTKTITFDGLPLLVTDAAEAAIGKLQTQIADATGTITARDATIVERDATIVARDADIVRMTAELADANDPAKRALRDAALRDAMAKAKALGVATTDAMLLGDVQKAVVTAKMPEKAVAYDANSFAIAFDSLTAGVKATDTNIVPIGAPQVIGDAVQRETTALKDANDHNAWRTAGKAA